MKKVKKVFAILLTLRMLHMGFEPTTYRLKAGYSTIELMEPVK